jgi:hypothetical protein
MPDEEIAVHYDENEGHAWLECNREGFLRFRELLRGELYLPDANLNNVIRIEIIDMTADARHFGNRSVHSEIWRTLGLLAVIVILVFADLGVRSVTAWF